MFVSNPPAPQRKTLVLLSGGLDSATVLALARLNTCSKVFTLSFDYGQTHTKELDSARRLSEHYNTCHLVVQMLSLHMLSGPTDASAVEYQDDVGLLPETWKPGRNIMFLTFAGAYAWEHDIHVIALGVHQEDYPGYPDCRLEFLTHMEQTLRQGLAHPVELWTPLLHMNKTQIVELGLKSKVPYELTWSCYKGGEKPCGKCDACIRRASAFKANKTKDPAL